MINWPSNLKPSSIMFEPNARSRSGGVGTFGQEQVVTSSAGVWIARISVPVSRRDQRLTWRAINAELEGRANVVLLPMFCADKSADLAIGVAGAGAAQHLPHSDQAFFSDDSGYTGGTADATILPAPLRATTVTLSVAPATTVIEAGLHFSVGTRLYRIRSAVGGVVTIWPPLREAILVPTPANFSAPACQMRLASDDSMQIEFDLGRLGVGNASFVEVP